MKANPKRKTVSLKEVSTLSMVAGNEKRFTKIVHSGTVKEWVGFGWVSERAAKYPEDNLLTHVAE